MLLGASKLTVGRYGCTTTSLAMLSDYFKCYMSPKDIASHKDWYTKGANAGLVIWQALSFPKMAFLKREYGENDNAIQQAINDPNKAVILEVADSSHWVVAIKYSPLWKDYLIADPWTGTKVWAKSKYRNITGAAYFGKKF